MRRLAASLVLGLVVVGVATAARGDPQKQITPADQARAKAMLIRQADVGRDLKAYPTTNLGNPYCKADDESDLVLTGEAYSMAFARVDISYLVVSSGLVYKTAAQNAASWRRETSAAAMPCLQLSARLQLQSVGATVVSFAKIAFPRLAPGTVAYRTTARLADGRPFNYDVVGFSNGRAQSTLFFFGAPSAYLRSEEVRLGGIVARRMATAMARR